MLQISRFYSITILFAIAFISYTNQCEEDIVSFDEKTAYFNVKEGSVEYITWRLFLSYTSPSLVKEFEDSVKLCPNGFINWNFLQSVQKRSSPYKYTQALDLFAGVIQSNGPAWGKSKLKSLDENIKSVIKKRESELNPNGDKKIYQQHVFVYGKWQSIHNQTITAISKSTIN